MTGMKATRPGVNVSLANCYFTDDSPEFQRNVTMLHSAETRRIEFLRTTALSFGEAQDLTPVYTVSRGCINDLRNSRITL
jgi:hypothetical protein